MEAVITVKKDTRLGKIFYRDLSWRETMSDNLRATGKPKSSTQKDFTMASVHTSSNGSSDESSWSYDGLDDTLVESPQWSSHWSKSEESVKYPHVPEAYRVIEALGEGSYGTVYRCLKPGTDEEVAVKTANDPLYHLNREAKIMRTLMSEKLDEANIVKYHGELFVDNQVSLVYETLDKSFDASLEEREEPLTLDDIRNVIQQLAVSFDGLKKVGVIHTDLKLDNIMLVDKTKLPLKIKLIDFGMAMFTHETKAGQLLQVPEFRAPEIFFGLPYSEAIDIWSLGIIMGFMIILHNPFMDQSEHEILKTLTKMLGPPPTHLLDTGVRTQTYFTKNGDSWTLKECNEEEEQPLQENNQGDFFDLVMTQREGVDDDPDELKECVDLLKAMLQWDAKDRITPEGILNHPFMTRSSAKNITPSNQKPEDSGFSSGTNSDESFKTQSSNSNSSEHPETFHRLNCMGAPAIPNGCAEPSHPELAIEELEEEESETESNCFTMFFSWMKKTFTCCGASEVPE